MASVSSHYNQNGGGYFMVLSDLEAGGNQKYVNTFTPANPAGSGGAFAVGTFALASMSSVVGVADPKYSTLVAQGKLLKDMGKTVVSSGRTFRKFAPVVPTGVGINVSPNNLTSPSNGVFGAAPASGSAGPGYATFYLEVGRDGAGIPAPVVRYV